MTAKIPVRGLEENRAALASLYEALSKQIESNPFERTQIEEKVNALDSHINKHLRTTVIDLCKNENQRAFYEEIKKKIKNLSFEVGSPLIKTIDALFVRFEESKLRDIAKDPKALVCWLNEKQKRVLIREEDIASPFVKVLDAFEEIKRSSDLQEKTLSQMVLLALNIYLKEKPQVSELFEQGIIDTRALVHFINFNRCSVEGFGLSIEQLIEIAPFLNYVECRDIDFKSSEEVENFIEKCSNARKIVINSDKLEEVKKCPQGVRSFHLSGCSFLKTIHLKDLKDLEELDLSGCIALKEVSISNSEKLQEISFPLSQFLDHQLDRELVEERSSIFNHSLETLSLSNLESLKKLSLTYSKLLKTLSLSNLKSLEDISLPISSSLTHLFFSNLESLQNINFYRFKFLETVDLSNLQKVEEVHFTDCPSLREVLISNLENLKYLCLNHNFFLKKISLSNLPLLDYLGLSSCSSLVTLSLSNLNALEAISLSKCVLLEEIHGLNLEALYALDLTSLACLKKLSLVNLKQLESLSFHYWLCLHDSFLGESYTSLESAFSLEEVTLSNLEALELIDLNFSGSLKNLRISDLKSLNELKLDGCRSLEVMNLSNLENLKTLSLRDCRSLEGFLVSPLVNLETLRCDRCTSLRSLDLSRNLRLETMTIDGANELTSLGDLLSHELRLLSCQSCPNLRQLPQVPFTATVSSGDTFNSFYVDPLELNQEPLKTLFRLGEILLRNCPLPNIVYVDPDTKAPTSGMDAGGLRRQFITTLFEALFKDESGFSFIREGSFFTPIVKDLNNEQEVKSLRILARIMALSYDSSVLVTGNFLSESFFYTVFSLSEGEMAQMSSPLQEEIRKKIYVYSQGKALEEFDEEDAQGMAEDPGVINAIGVIAKEFKSIFGNRFNQIKKNVPFFLQKVQGVIVTKESLKRNLVCDRDDYKIWVDRFIDDLDRGIISDRNHQIYQLKHLVMLLTGAHTLSPQRIHLSVLNRKFTESSCVIHTCTQTMELANDLTEDLLREELKRSLLIIDVFNAE
jgi:hypothetical protein